MKIPNFERLKKFDEPMLHQLNDILTQVVNAVNCVEITQDGTTDENVFCYLGVTTTPGVADTDFSITHDLKRVPLGYILIKTDKAARIYTGSVAWTDTTISLKCDTATVACTIMII